MNCPACNRNLASTLSVCPSCGTMVNDSVREELALKISPISKPLKKIVAEKIVFEETPRIEKPVELPLINLTAEPVEAAPAEPEKISLPTDRFTPKPTSPILVEFQSKNAVIPEWRLQLQNSVRRRNHGGYAEMMPTPAQKVLATSGATALKTEVREQPAPAAATAANSTLEKALQRIEQSRQKYLVEETPKTVFPVQPKTFPHIVPNKSYSFPLDKTPNAEKPVFENKTKFAAPVIAPKPAKFDTNKLPPLPAKAISSFENTIEIYSEDTKIVKESESSLQIKAEESPDVLAYSETISGDEILTETIETENAEIEGDDRAPMMMRFNAGFFDLIIGGFTSFILLAPFTLASGNLFSFQGVLAFLATCSIVMFIYLTATIGMMGRTLGMKVFSLEIVDIEENAYPTFHQAAVSSSVYLVSLALGGIGFLTLFLNDENRAAHDLISGTIVVKECE